jgi:hypothetical protein
MPTNQHIRERLAAILRQLNAAHSGGSSLSSASKGIERESFTKRFLEQVLPSPYRFGTGDVTDSAGRLSGQIDVVIEHNSLPSFPMLTGDAVRLYLAEGVGAAVEVKSNLSTQWDEAIATGKKLGELVRPLGPIPLFFVGYKGWKNLDTLAEHVLQARADGIAVRGALILDPPLYFGVSTQQVPQQPPEVNEKPDGLDLGFVPQMPQMPQLMDIPVRADSEMGLLALIAEVHARVGSVLWEPDALWSYVNVYRE